MELGLGMYIFFGVAGVIGVAVALIFSVDSLGKKFNNIFEDDTRR